jgi:hypothetical protein
MTTVLKSLTVLLVVACGSQSADQSSGTEAFPLEKVAGELKKALCDKMFTCCSASERADNPDFGGDPQRCLDNLNGEATLLLGDLQASVDAGRVIYHPDKMSACLAKLKARSCGEAKMPPDNKGITQLCDGVFEPRVPVGGACSYYWDCNGGWCQGDIGGLADKCSPLTPEGGQCDEGPECVTGLCTDERVCGKLPPGTGSICALGTEGVGEHGAGGSRRWGRTNLIGNSTAR